MKLPPPLPALPPPAEMERAFLLLMTDETLAQELQRRYYSWDQLRHRPWPAGLRPEAVWHALQFSRRQTLRSLPQLVGLDGRPFRYHLTEPVLPDVLEIEAITRDPLGLVEIEEAPGDRQEFILNALMEEGIHSSILEGAATTRKKAKEMLRTGRPAKTVAERMVINNYLTIRLLGERAAEPLTVEFIGEIHRSMTRGTLELEADEGRIQQPEEERVRVQDVDGTVLHMPPPAAALPGRLRALCEFANDPAPFPPPVVRAALLHFQLSFDHPFVDGNGRTARALFYWATLHRDRPLFRYLTISRAILKSRVQYARAFLDAEQTGDLSYFLAYHSTVVRRAVEELVRYLRHKREERQTAAEALRDWPMLNLRQRLVVGEAVKNSDRTCTATQLMRRHGVVRATALADLKGLVTLGLFEQVRRGKELVFQPVRELVRRLDGGGVR